MLRSNLDRGAVQPIRSSWGLLGNRLSCLEAPAARMPRKVARWCFEVRKSVRSLRGRRSSGTRLDGRLGPLVAVKGRRSCSHLSTPRTRYIAHVRTVNRNTRSTYARWAFAEEEDDLELWWGEPLVAGNRAAVEWWAALTEQRRAGHARRHIVADLPRGRPRGRAARLLDDHSRPRGSVAGLGPAS